MKDTDIDYRESEHRWIGVASYNFAIMAQKETSLKIAVKFFVLSFENLKVFVQIAKNGTDQNESEARIQQVWFFVLPSFSLCFKFYVNLLWQCISVIKKSYVRHTCYRAKLATPENSEVNRSTKCGSTRALLPEICWFAVRSQKTCLIIRIFVIRKHLLRANFLVS